MYKIIVVNFRCVYMPFISLGILITFKLSQSRQFTQQTSNWPTRATVETLYGNYISLFQKLHKLQEERRSCPINIKLTTFVVLTFCFEDSAVDSILLLVIKSYDSKEYIHVQLFYYYCCAHKFQNCTQQKLIDHKSKTSNGP